MFKSVLFYTNKLKPMKRFYANVLELDITDSGSEYFTVNVGETDITFQHSETPSFYHFAINTPGNQFIIMKEWIESKLTLNLSGGVDKIYYQSLGADSIYFEDPAGNLIELIARRNRDLFGPLTKEAFFDVSEVAVTTPYLSQVGEELQDIGVPLRHGTEVEPDEANYLGRGDSFVVLVPPAWKWEFAKRKTETHPLEITFQDGQHVTLNAEGVIVSYKD
ncbi:hypothetical protein QGM71_17345 [Virgibacillus sp. C22-A2]|uniref:VOC domain-containing protein n=1 Tax=Virgibacillus tibetensis TaxID=3042313 RepID=A0ABU6KJF2_9BACI|nr:hypothetical protein [Virgibacillus sp. C22-A2]